MGLRRVYHKHVGYQQRFVVAVGVTVVVVAAVAVPWVASVIEGLGTYGPGAYDPRDFARTHWLRSITDPASWTTEALVNAGLFVLLAVVWFMTTSGGRPGGRSR